MTEKINKNLLKDKKIQNLIKEIEKLIKHHEKLINYHKKKIDKIIKDSQNNYEKIMKKYRKLDI